MRQKRRRKKQKVRRTRMRAERDATAPWTAGGVRVRLRAHPPVRAAQGRRASYELEYHILHKKTRKEEEDEND